MAEEEKPEVVVDEPPEAGTEKTSEELAEQKTQLEKDVQGLATTKESLLKDVTEAREERRQARSEQEQQPGDSIETADDLIQATKKQTAEAVDPVKQSVDKLSKAQKDKAVRKFVEGKNEYSASEDPDDAKLNKIVSLAESIGEESDQYDADLFYELLEDVHFSRNRKSIQKELQDHRNSKSETDIAAANIVATTGSGSGARPGEDEETITITKFHRELAAKLGKTPEEVAKLDDQARETHLGT